MAAYFFAAGTKAEAASGNITPALPTGWAADDINILVVTSADVVTHSVTGYTQIFQTSSGTTLNRSIWYRRAVGGDGNPTVTHASGSTIVGRIYGFRGAITTGSPINASGEQSNASSVTVTAPTITPASGELVIFTGSGTNADTSTDVTWSNLSGTNPTFTYNAGLNDFSGAGLLEASQVVGFGASSDGAATGARTATAAAAVLNIGTMFSLKSAITTSPVQQDIGAAQESQGNITVPWPPHITNDVALLFIESAGGEPANLGTANGFAAVTNSPQATGVGTAGTQLTVYWCRATSAAMASPVVTDPGNHAYGVIVTFRGCITTGDPWDITAGSVKASASTTTTWDSAVTTVNNCLILSPASRDTDSAAAAWSNFAGGNGTLLGELFDRGTALGNGGGLVVNLSTLDTAGASGAPTATVANSINAEMTIALKPPVAAGGAKTLAALGVG